MPFRTGKIDALIILDPATVTGELRELIKLQRSDTLSASSTSTFRATASMELTLIMYVAAARLCST